MLVISFALAPVLQQLLFEVIDLLTVHFPVLCFVAHCENTSPQVTFQEYVVYLSAIRIILSIYSLFLCISLLSKTIFFNYLVYGVLLVSSTMTIPQLNCNRIGLCKTFVTDLPHLCISFCAVLRNQFHSSFLALQQHSMKYFATRRINKLHMPHS